MTLTRLARSTSAAVVAGVAAIASYSHMRTLALENGQGDLLAALLPVSVDGMLVTASAVMADDRAAGRPVRLSARVSFVTGVAASIVANVLAAPDNLVARVISAWPALALLLVVEMLTGGQRRDKTLLLSDAGQSDEMVVKTTLTRAGGRPSTAERVLAARAADPDASVVDIALTAGVSQRTVRRHLNGTPVG